MLTSLLPGIRELRTPLAAGYIYVVTLLLLFGEHLPTEEEAPAPLEPFYALVEWAGKPAAFASSIFIAYLLGSMLELSPVAVARLTSGPLLRAKPTPSGRIMYSSPLLSRRSMRDLVVYARGRLWPTQQAETLSPEDEDALSEGLTKLLSELPELRTRLYAANQDLYGDYDRKAAEASFKVNVGIAGIALSFAARAVLNPWWTLACAAMFLLILRGIVADREAKTVLVEALAADQVQSPQFDAFVAKQTSGDGEHYGVRALPRAIWHMTAGAAVAALRHRWWRSRRHSTAGPIEQ
ncbi:hypothetical protein ACFC0N_37475 [Streptomyces zaomyceticus]|uniref:hypothetical protein n=1 Tax=Streptomyces zaomyceticus TaxID=68286 RepID=UPI0035E0262F